MDDCNKAGSDFVHEGEPTLNWQIVCEASGVVEPIKNTRHHITKMKVTIAKTNKKKRQAKASTSKLKTKGY